MYLPKIKIKKPSKDDIGKLVDNAGNPFKGSFFETYKGQLFSGDRPTKDSIPLENQDKHESEHDDDKESVFKNEYVEPTASQLRDGKFERFFIQDKRTNNIAEVTKQKFENLNDPFYINKISLEWIISPPAKDVYYNGVKYEGAETVNKKTVKNLINEMKGLDQYIEDYAEFIPSSNIDYSRFNPPAKGINTFDLPAPASTSILKKAKTNQDEPQNLLRENLYANPGEFINMDTGEEYIGPYHEHPENGPMVGAKHIKAKHARLQRVRKLNEPLIQTETVSSEEVQQEVNTVQQSTPSTTPSSSPSPSTNTGTSTSSGGYGGY